MDGQHRMATPWRGYRLQRIRCTVPVAVTVSVPEHLDWHYVHSFVHHVRATGTASALPSES